MASRSFLDIPAQWRNLISGRLWVDSYVTIWNGRPLRTIDTFVVASGSPHGWAPSRVKERHHRGAHNPQRVMLARAPRLHAPRASRPITTALAAEDWLRCAPVCHGRPLSGQAFRPGQLPEHGTPVTSPSPSRPRTNCRLASGGPPPGWVLKRATASVAGLALVRPYRSQRRVSYPLGAAAVSTMWHLWSR